MDFVLILKAMEIMREEMGIKGFVIDSKDDELLFEVLDINSAIKQMNEIIPTAEKHPEYLKGDNE